MSKSYKYFFFFFGWGERKQWINAETGFGWLCDRLTLLPVKVQEMCSVSARKRRSKHQCLARRCREKGFFNRCYEHYSKQLVLYSILLRNNQWRGLRKGWLHWFEIRLEEEHKTSTWKTVLMEIPSATYLWAAKQCENTKIRMTENQCKKKVVERSKGKLTIWHEVHIKKNPMMQMFGAVNNSVHLYYS